jgi:hypothetical protein
MLGIGLAPHMEKGDAAAASKVVDEVKAAYPNTTLAKQSEELKKSMADAIRMLKESDDDKEENTPEDKKKNETQDK